MIMMALFLLAADPVGAGASTDLDRAKASYEACFAAERDAALARGILPSIFSDVARDLCPLETDAYRDALVAKLGSAPSSSTVTPTTRTNEQLFAEVDAGNRAQLVISYIERQRSNPGS